VFETIAAASQAAAPHVGSALLTGAKALVASLVAAKATKYANTQIMGTLDHLAEAREEAKLAKTQAEFDALTPEAIAS
jgi:hypothetical protein